jgi:hypothetical protein
MGLLGTHKVLDHFLIGGIPSGQGIPHPSIFPDSEEVVLEFSNNLMFRQSYFNLREKCYRADLGLDGFFGGWDHYDTAGNVLIARKGEEVVGGVRIIENLPGGDTLLPLESEDFRLKNIYPDLGLETSAYCEFSRLAVERSSRVGGHLAKDIIVEATREAKARGIRYLFAVSTPLQARCYRKVFRALGHDYIIDNSVEVPQKEIYGHLNMVLAYCDFESFV